MKTDPEIDTKYTKENPDLQGFDLDAMAGLAAHSDGSGGGVRALAWEMQKLRELRERIALLDAFILKYQLVLARLSWTLNDTVLHPTKKHGREKDLAVLVPQIALCSYACDMKHKATAADVAACWPAATWRRSMPYYGDRETRRDYTADVDGVLIRITDAERLAPMKEVGRFGPCGPVRLSSLAGSDSRN